MSAALLKEDENQKQRPMFFVSKSMSEAETRYTLLEQATLALQAHLIIVLTNVPLRRTIHKCDLSGRMAWWAIELSEFGIQYKLLFGVEGADTSRFF